MGTWAWENVVYKPYGKLRPLFNMAVILLYSVQELFNIGGA